MRKPKYIYFNPFFRFCFSTSPEDHIFVVGAPRSGTTLLANVIANHSNVCSYGGETGLFGWRTCFMIFEGMAGRNSYELNRLRRQCRDVVELFDKLANECKSGNNCARFLEKTPQHVFHLRFILNRFPNARIVNVLRDPRDCYVSSKSHANVVQGAPREYAKYWKRCVESRARFAGHPRILDVRYERFVNEPRDVLTGIMQWLGEDFESDQINPEKMGKDRRAGNPKYGLLGARISNSSVDKWKRELSEHESRAIEEVVGGLLGTVRVAV